MGSLTAEEVEKVKAIVEKRGKDWLIAAMIHGSIGYHSVGSAENMIEAVLKGRYWGCERTSACFDGDPIREIMRDVADYEFLEQYAPETAKGVLAYVEKTRNLDHIAQQTLGLMYPTLGL